jgi:hypothetical protein
MQIIFKLLKLIKINIFQILLPLGIFKKNNFKLNKNIKEKVSYRNTLVKIVQKSFKLYKLRI